MDANEQQVTQTGVTKPNSDGRGSTSAANGARGGRPRVRLDHRKWNWLFLDGGSNEVIARALGVSVRTLQRRKVDRRRQDDPSGW